MPTEEEIARERCKRLMKSDEEIDRAVVFVEHVERHLREDVSFSRHAKVLCKICNRSIDDIYEEERA